MFHWFMDEHVTFELVFTVERVLTDVTLKWFVVAVYHRVHLEVMVSLESFCTHVALILSYNQSHHCHITVT